MPDVAGKCNILEGCMYSMHLETMGRMKHGILFALMRYFRDRMRLAYIREAGDQEVSMRIGSLSSFTLMKIYQV